MDIATIKQRQPAAWASGDDAAVGVRIPDVACGNGSLAAARRFCQVTA
jgi:hypothetical protein